jgi:DNA-directed RNA polymerase specialized sigma24 family protein
MTSFPSLSDPQPGSNASTAIHQLMRQRGGMIFGLRQKFCGNDDDATNPVQETMLEAFKSWPLFRGGAKATNLSANAREEWPWGRVSFRATLSF